MQSVVHVDNLGKRFARHQDKPFLMRSLIPGLGRARAPVAELWPVRNVSFELAPGEALGIVGGNGAGKTTLLSLIAGVIHPTEGAVQVRGRVAALLALGLGFHQDMTGRECIRVNGVLLGMSRAEAEERTDEILAFAELAEFADTPTRFYSSGMLARLGFSVATAVEPDLFIVDEALSVGDAAFQAKCIARIQSLQQTGVGLLFVSHSLNLVEKLCTRALWLDRGRVRAFGPAAEVCAAYAGGAQPQK